VLLYYILVFLILPLFIDKIIFNHAHLHHNIFAHILGSYDAKLTFDIHPAKRQIPQKPRYETGPLQLLAPHIKPVVPSIPTRYQSYGYEDAQDGRLIPQEPVRPGFTGLGNDSAGPGDYEPDISLKYAAVPAANFAKVS